MERTEVIILLNKIINKFILQASKFIEYSAFPYGLFDLVKYNQKSNKLTYDYEYFVFTKSTKTLIAIRELLKKGLNEDVIILVRSIFENYLSCRYLNENEDKLDDFIKNPLSVTLAYYIVNENSEIIDREKNVVGKINNPNLFKIGMDKKYYYDFYDFLSKFAHCNFGIIDCYLNEHKLFTHQKINHEVLSRLFAVFVFTKIFEHVVTVEGEEFCDIRTEKNCYKLVNEALSLQETILDMCISELKTDDNDIFKFKNKRLKSMLKNMKKSLKEELGNVIK